MCAREKRGGLSSIHRYRGVDRIEHKGTWMYTTATVEHKGVGLLDVADIRVPLTCCLVRNYHKHEQLLWVSSLTRTAIRSSD